MLGGQNEGRHSTAPYVNVNLNQHRSHIMRRGNTNLIGNKTAQRAQLKRDCKGVKITILDSTASAYQVGDRGHIISKRSGKKTSEFER